MNKTLVITHKSDFDGIFCREIAKKFLPVGTEFVGWDYGDPVPSTEGFDQIYMLDISIEPLMNDARLVWIDHHKSAMEKYHHGIPGYRIDGVAACRLAYAWFSIVGQALAGDYSLEKLMVVLGAARNTEGVEPHNNNVKLPAKADYVDRLVIEPWAVRLAGEYDIKDERDPDAALFQHGMRSHDISVEAWSIILESDRRMTVSEIEQLMSAGHTTNLLNPDGTTPNPLVTALLASGRFVRYAKEQENKEIMAAYGFDVEFEGLQFLACNHARYNTQLFEGYIKPHHDGLMGFNWTGTHWRVSMFGVPGKPDIDLSQIAIKMGGGGHKQACGFTVKNLPFGDKLPWTTPAAVPKLAGSI